MHFDSLLRSGAARRLILTLGVSGLLWLAVLGVLG